MLPNIATVFAINRYAFCLANPIAVLIASGSMFPNLSYYYNGEYLTWWEQWGWTIFLGVGIIATIIACVFSGPCGGVATAATVAATLKAIALGSIVGTATALLIGGTIAGIQSALTGHGFWQAFTEYAEENFVEELIISFAFTSVATAASSLIKCFQCFKEGTLVETEEGLKPIEEIEVGDRVLAYDEETGEQAYKEVTRLFRNQTMKWCTVSVVVNGAITDIISTPGHKYYLPDNIVNREVGVRQEHASYYGLSEKWVSANKLKTGDKVLLSDGEYGIIQAVKVEELSSPETTYNLEIADFHTYYVGNGVCVHNKGCDGVDIVGTEHSEFRPTQDEINIDIVNEYVQDIKAGKTLKAIEVARNSDGGIYILNGHHRYVASKLMGIKPDMIYLSSGPKGLPNWSSVKYVTKFTPW